jgi:hypothetical protein
MTEVYVISRVIGTVALDVTTDESHDSTMKITENPVESGAVIADHAVIEPRTVSIRGTMVDWSQQAVNVPTSIQNAPRADVDFLDQMALPAGVSSFTSGTLIQARRLGDPSAYSQTLVQISGAQRALAPWLPNFAPADSLDMSTGTKRVEQVFDALRSVQKSADPVEIITGSQSYENMLLTAVSMQQRWDGWAEIRIEAHEIFIVETRRVSGISVKSAATGKNKNQLSGRAKIQALDTREKGNVQITPVRATTSTSGATALSRM